jgi:hypothetical protein
MVLVGATQSKGCDVADVARTMWHRGSLSVSAEVPPRQYYSKGGVLAITVRKTAVVLQWQGMVVGEEVDERFVQGDDV